MSRKRLNFDPEYLELLVNGEKKSTIRMRTRLKPGDVVDVYAGDSYVGMAKILEVRLKKMSQLTERDAKIDGFKNLKDLKKALKKHYGYIPDNTKLSIIYFKFFSSRKSMDR